MTVFLAFIFFKPSSTDKLTAVLCTPISLTYSCTFWGSCITNMETAALAEQFHNLLFSHIDAKTSDKWVAYDQDRLFFRGFGVCVQLMVSSYKQMNLNEKIMTLLWLDWDSSMLSVTWLLIYHSAHVLCSGTVCVWKKGLQCPACCVQQEAKQLNGPAVVGYISPPFILNEVCLTRHASFTSFPRRDTDSFFSQERKMNILHLADGH